MFFHNINNREVKNYIKYYNAIYKFCFDWPCGLMDKALDFESRDCGFESRHGRFLIIVKSCISMVKLVVKLITLIV